MRTKLLLLSAAALAAGAASSVAQSNVFSVNVVGYVNQPLTANVLTAVANPLDNGTNTLDSALSGVPAKSTAQFWTGAGFTSSTKGVSAWVPNNAIPPGVGFFVNSKAAYTNTYVGSVACNVGASVTNALPANVLVLVGSKIPYAGDLNDTNLAINLPAKSIAQFWTGAGYTSSTRGVSAWVPALSVGVAQGFFLNSKAPYDWIQTLPAN
jgi:hypothetical protein